MWKPVETVLGQEKSFFDVNDTRLDWCCRILNDYFVLDSCFLNPCDAPLMERSSSSTINRAGEMIARGQKFRQLFNLVLPASGKHVGGGEGGRRYRRIEGTGCCLPPWAFTVQAESGGEVL